MESATAAECRRHAARSRTQSRCGCICTESIISFRSTSRMRGRTTALSARRRSDGNWRARKATASKKSSPGCCAGHNVGVCLRDDQLVIDVDPRNFEGSDRLAELCARFGIKPDDYPCVYSGGGGRHIYMSKSPLLQNPRDARRACPGSNSKRKGLSSRGEPAPVHPGFQTSLSR